MKIEKLIEVPTGYICIGTGELGKPLEFLSIGDYGKSSNVKADFLGYTEEINGVKHHELLPLEDKWVITISSQYGCSMGCKFCDVSNVGPGINATIRDLLDQVDLAMSLHPEVKQGRINLHYARMGEPTWNLNVLTATYMLQARVSDWGFKFHPVVSTMMPRYNRRLMEFINEWLTYKEFANGDAGLQISVNTTDDAAREYMFNGNALPLVKAADLLALDYTPSGRKITLNFALTGADIDGKLLSSLFDPEKFMCKITPIHATTACEHNGYRAEGYNAYDIYKPVEENLKEHGFDVLVFVPSLEEDESRITCGNAILAQ